MNIQTTRKFRTVNRVQNERFRPSNFPDRPLFVFVSDLLITVLSFFSLLKVKSVHGTVERLVC
jgi:hypothetical protein